MNLKLKLFLFSLLPLCTAAQTKDAQLWTSVNLQKKIAPAVMGSFAQEIRFNENISETGTIFSDLGFEYRLSKALRFSLNYRFIQRRHFNDSYGTSHRYYFDAAWRKEAGNLMLTLRSRVQSQYREYFSSENGTVADWYWRQKVVMKYDLKRKIVPFAAIEFFYQLSNPAGNEYDQVRYSAGAEYEFNKSASVEFFYLLQREFNVNNPEYDFVIGVGYNYRFR
jgi:hypothetical protein